MVFSSNVFSIQELKDEIVKSYPGIEQQLKEIFFEKDIAGDGFLPYKVVEPLLRHFFFQCGLADYLQAVTDSEGKLRNADLAPYLKETTLKDISNYEDDTLIRAQEMVLMAIVWLKLISDVYQKEDADVTAVCDLGGNLCCPTSGEYTAVEKVVNRAANNTDKSGQLENSEENLLEGDAQYTEHINDEVDEKEIRQKNVETYIQTLVNETSMNRKQGVKCYVYSAATIANGSCVSAGAAVPQRRPPRPKDKKPSAGCC